MGTINDIVANLMSQNQAAADAMTKNVMAEAMKTTPQKQQQGMTQQPNNGLFSGKTNKAIAGAFNPSPTGTATQAAPAVGAAPELAPMPADFGDADFQEPGGPAHITLREEPFGLLMKNQLTGEMGKVAQQPLTHQEKQMAMAPHGAGPLNGQRQTTQVSDMDLMNPMNIRGQNPSSGSADVLNGSAMNVMGTAQQFSNDATQYNRQGSSDPRSQQFADADLMSDTATVPASSGDYEAVFGDPQQPPTTPWSNNYLPPIQNPMQGPYDMMDQAQQQHQQLANAQQVANQQVRQEAQQSLLHKPGMEPKATLQSQGVNGTFVRDQNGNLMYVPNGGDRALDVMSRDEHPGQTMAGSKIQPWNHGGGQANYDFKSLMNQKMAEMEARIKAGIEERLAKKGKK